MERRTFLRTTARGATVLPFLAGLPMAVTAAPQLKKLTILHTNDVHSRIDPFPMDGSRTEGLGGAARRAKLIEQIRLEESNVLLLDSGDIFQGTPYFNFFAGELEIKIMTEMGYDATTIGNHDFDAGLEGLLRQMPHASFPFIVSNYDFSDTPLHQKTLPYQVFDKAGIRVGVLGVGIELQGLVPEKLYGATQYLDPLDRATETADLLRHEQKCDYIICLSHLGYRYAGDRIDDLKFAKGSRNIDLILGGHTHTFMREPEVLSNQEGKPVIVNQVGWAGMMLGRIDVHFEKNRPNRCVTCKNQVIR